MKNSAFENFSEDAQSILDFARCQRPDGSFYGTSGQCRKGAPAGAKEDKEKAGNLKQLRKDMIAARYAEKEAKAARQKAARRVEDSKSNVAHAKETLARKDLTSAERAKATTILKTSERQLKKDKAEAAETRRAHIESKNKMKSAAETFKKAQTESGDVRRFGRDADRSKASTEELTNALRSGRLSPRKAAAVDREISSRLARAEADVKKRLETATGEEARKLRGQRANIEEAKNKLGYARRGLGTGQDRLTSADIKRAVGTFD